MRNGRTVIYALLFTMTMINYFDRVVLAVAMPTLATIFSLTPVSEGYLLSAFIWIYVVLQLPAGALLDRWGTRRLTAFAVGFWSLATAATALSFNYTTLVITRVLLGVGESPTYPAGIRAVREWAPLRERTFATAIFNAGSSFGTATSAIVVSWLLLTVGWRGAFVASGAIGMIWVVFWLMFFRDPAQARWLPDAERQMILAERSPGSTDDPGLSIRQLLRYRTMWGLFLVQGCVNYTQYLALTWLPTYLVRSRGFDLMHSGVDIAIVYLGACAINIGAGRAADGLLSEAGRNAGHRRYALVFFCALASVMLLVPFVQATWALLLVLTLSLAGVQCALTNDYAMVSDLVHTGGSTGRAVGWLQLGGNLFGLVAPIATGYLIAATGSFTSAFLMAGFLLLMGGVFALTLTGRPVGARRGQPHDGLLGAAS